MDVYHKIRRCTLSIVVVYGPAHEELKGEFLSELARLCATLTYPFIVGGDF